MNRINQYLLGILLLGMISFTGIVVKSGSDSLSDSPYNPQSVVVNSLLTPYVNEYICLLEAEEIKIPWGKDLVLIGFDPGLPSNILGIAWGMDIDNVTVIDINMKHWPRLSEQQRRLLVFHEITHDVFNTRHFETSLMNTPMPRYVSKLKVDSAMQELIKYLNNKK